MAIVGNNSTSTAVFIQFIGTTTASVTFSAPFDGHVASISMFCSQDSTAPGPDETIQINFAMSNDGVLGLVMPHAAQSTTPATQTQPIVTGPFDAAQGTSIILTISEPLGSIVKLYGASAGVWDIWADFQPAAVPAAPSTAPVCAAQSISSWKVTPTATATAPITTSIVIERSQDGGSSWVTAGTIASPATFFIDTGVSPGPLQYRTRNANTTGAGAPSPAFTCVAPLAPLAPTLTALSMTTWGILINPNAAQTTIGPIVGQWRIQRSQDGGSTWSNIHSQTTTPITAYVDTVSAGALAYRTFAENSVGSTVSPTMTATAPVYSSAPTYSEVLT